jgi:hypothetical protein
MAAAEDIGRGLQDGIFLTSEQVCRHDLRDINQCAANEMA